jgi:hypothetical protein
VGALSAWALQNQPKIAGAQQAYDARAATS